MQFAWYRQLLDTHHILLLNCWYRVVLATWASAGAAVSLDSGSGEWGRGKLSERVWVLVRMARTSSDYIWYTYTFICLLNCWYRVVLATWAAAGAAALLDRGFVQYSKMKPSWMLWVLVRMARTNPDMVFSREQRGAWYLGVAITDARRDGVRD